MLREFFKNLKDPPWLDRDSFLPGQRAFYNNVSDTVAAFLCGVLVEGFTTLIRKSFVITGRVASEPTQRRQKQNIRQLIEIFLPDGLQRYGDGWKLSMRIRFVHARVRYMLWNSDKWNSDAWGTPICAAHLGFAIALFSAGLMQYSKLMGAKYNQEEIESVLQVWRYSGYVMGIPESILYADEGYAIALRRIAHICEPPMDADSVTMIKAWLDSAAPTAGITDPDRVCATTKLVYRLSRALMGRKLADQMQLPANGIPGTLLLYRLEQRIKKLLPNRLESKTEDFALLMQSAAYDDVGLSYKMPDHVEQRLSSDW